MEEMLARIIRRVLRTIGWRGRVDVRRKGLQRISMSFT